MENLPLPHNMLGDEAAPQRDSTQPCTEAVPLTQIDDNNANYGTNQTSTNTSSSTAAPTFIADNSYRQIQNSCGIYITKQNLNYAMITNFIIMIFLGVITLCFNDEKLSASNDAAKKDAKHMETVFLALTATTAILEFGLLCFYCNMPSIKITDAQAVYAQSDSESGTSASALGDTSVSDISDREQMGRDDLAGVTTTIIELPSPDIPHATTVIMQPEPATHTQNESTQNTVISSRPGAGARS